MVNDLEKLLKLNKDLIVMNEEYRECINNLLEEINKNLEVIKNGR